MTDTPRRHAVENGIINFLSVSQLEQFDPHQEPGCNRRWWYVKVGHKPEPFSAAKGLGTDSHSLLEHYENTGEDVLPLYLSIGKHLIPAMRDWEPGKILVEQSTDMGVPLTVAGIPVIGRIDLVNATGCYTNDEGQVHEDPTGTIEIADHKTTKSIAKYAKVGPALVRTIQMPGYAEWARRQYPNAKHFRLSHNYFQTEGRPKAFKSTILIPLETVQARWSAVEKIAREMQQVAKETDPAKVPANLNACKAYGGCPHRPYCHPLLPAAVLFSEIFGGLKKKLPVVSTVPPAPEAPALPTPHEGVPVMSLLSRVAAKSPAAPPPPKTPAPPAPSAPKVPDPAVAARAKAAQEAAAAAEAKAREDLLAQEAAAKAKAEAEAAAARPAEDTSIFSKDARHGEIVYSHTRATFLRAICLTTGGMSFQTPTGSPAPTVLLEPTLENVIRLAEVTQGHLDLFPPLPAAVPQAPKLAAVAPPDVPASDPAKASVPVPPGADMPDAVRAASDAAHGTPAAQAEAAAEVKRGRGRPPGAKNKATLDAEAKAEAERLAAESGAGGTIIRSEVAPETPADTSGEFHLYIDCIPDREGLTFVSLEPYVDRITAALAKHAKVSDIRFAPETPLAFGAWKGALAAACKQNPPEPGSYYLLGVGTDEVKTIVCSSLGEFATQVTRGVR